MKKRDFFRLAEAKEQKSQGTQNPLFKAPKQSFFKRLLKIILPIFLTVVCFTALIIYLNSPKFLISNVKTNGLVNLEESVVIHEIDGYLKTNKKPFFSKEQKLLLSKKNLTSYLEGELPIKITDLKIEKNTLFIEIVENITIVNLKNGEEWLIVDLDGKIIKQQTEPIKDSPQILTTSPLSSEQKNNQILPPEVIDKIIDLEKRLPDFNLMPKDYILNKPNADWLTVNLTNVQFYIKFDTKKPINQQLDALKEALNVYKETSSNLTYIDVRFGNRVFIK